MQHDPEHVSVTRLAQLLGESPTTIRYRCRTGKIPAEKSVGGRPWRCPFGPLLVYLDRNGYERAVAALRADRRRFLEARGLPANDATSDASAENEVDELEGEVESTRGWTTTESQTCTSERAAAQRKTTIRARKEATGESPDNACPADALAPWMKTWNSARPDNTWERLARQSGDTLEEIWAMADGASRGAATRRRLVAAMKEIGPWPLNRRQLARITNPAEAAA